MLRTVIALRKARFEFRARFEHHIEDVIVSGAQNKVERRFASSGWDGFAQRDVLYAVVTSRGLCSPSGPTFSHFLVNVIALRCNGLPRAGD